MPTVTYNGDSFSCTKAVKGVDYIDLYSDNVLIVKFGGVVDFSKFTISDGSWSEPAGAEDARGTATLSDGILIIAIDEEVGDNTLVKFCAPCACSEVTSGVQIGDTLYTVVDASGNVVTGTTGGAWATGALVSLLLSKSTAKAYIQNSAVSDAYTKEQALSASTRTKFGFGASATPDDVLLKLYEEGPHKLGDMKLTVRADVGEEWVLCNGDYFSPDEYPDYAVVCPDQIALLHLSRFLHYNSSYPNVWGRIIDAGGYQVALREVYDIENEKYYLHLVYSTDWFDTYTQYRPYDDTGSTVFSNDAELPQAIIRYIDNTWFIACCPRSGMPGALCTYTTSDITDASSWKCHCDRVNYGNPGIETFLDAWKDDATGNIYIACCGENDSDCNNRAAYIMTLTSLTATAASTTCVSTSTTYIGGFCREGGMLAFFGRPYSGTYANLTIDYAQSMSHAWTHKNISANVTGTYPYFYRPGYGSTRYHNGVWYMWGDYRVQEQYTTSSGDTSTRTRYYPAIMYTRDLTADEWTLVYNTDISDTYQDRATLYDVVFGRDYFVGVTGIAISRSDSYVLFMEDITDASTWQWVNLATCCPYVVDNSTSKAEHGYLQQCLGVTTDASIIFPCTYDLLMKMPLYALPMYTNPNYHTYIKVKE